MEPTSRRRRGPSTPWTSSGTSGRRSRTYTRVEPVLFAAGDFVVAEVAFAGTQKGQLRSFKASNKHVTGRFADIMQRKDGKLAHETRTRTTATCSSRSARWRPSARRRRARRPPWPPRPPRLRPRSRSERERVARRGAASYTPATLDEHPQEDPDAEGHEADVRPARHEADAGRAGHEGRDDGDERARQGAEPRPRAGSRTWRRRWPSPPRAR